jgi:poly(A) polymerase
MEKLVRKIIKLSKGYEVFGVGGFARDLIIGRKHTDIDLAVNKNALAFSKILAKALKAKLIVLDDISKTYRLILKNDIVENIDISLFAGETIVKDLQARDFTINAIAFDIRDFENPKKNFIFADERCLKDLRSKSVNVVSNKTFKQDALRMLRAFRFCGELNFEISQETLKEIEVNAKRISKIAPERIKVELFRILSCPNSAALIKQMDKTGLLEEIFPEIKKMKAASKKFYYHKGGLFEHSFQTYEAIENIINNIKKYFPNNFFDIDAHLHDNQEFSSYVSRAGLLKFAALFHDNAKPETAKREGKKVRFLGHEIKGSDKICKITKLLMLSKKDLAFVRFLILNHMRPSNLTKNNAVTKRAELKFFREIEDKTVDLIILSMADWHSYKNLKVHSPKELKNQEKTVRRMISDYYELKSQKPLPKIIDGNIIMEKFQLLPGPWLKDLINLVLDNQKEGKISDTKMALSLIAQKLTPILKRYKIALNK